MEPVSLTLGAIVAGLVAKAGERASERAVDGSEDAVRRLVGRLRQRFSDDAPAAGALALVEQEPDGTSSIAHLAAHVDQHAADPGFRRELEALVAQARAKGAAVDAVQQTASGGRNVQIAEVAGSQVSVSYGTPLPDHPTS